MYDVSLLLFLISNLWTRVFNLLFQLTKLHDAIVLDLSARDNNNPFIWIHIIANY